MNLPIGLATKAPQSDRQVGPFRGPAICDGGTGCSELGSAFLTAAFGVPNNRTLDTATAYLSHWLEVLKSDSKAIFTAATGPRSGGSCSFLQPSLWKPEEEPEAVAAYVGGFASPPGR